MNKNAIYLVMFAVILGASIVSSCIFVPKCQWNPIVETTYQNATIYGSDGEEIGHVMLPTSGKIPDSLIPPLRHACLAMISVLLTFISCMGVIYNISRLRGWEPYIYRKKGGEI